MPIPATYDFMWVRGTTTPLRISLAFNGAPIAYDDVRLSVYAGSKLAFRLTLADNSSSSGDPGTVRENSPGDISFIPTAAQTRALAMSKNDGSAGKNSYEVEIRGGLDEEVYMLGTVTAIGGLNDDEDAGS